MVHSSGKKHTRNHYGIRTGNIDTLQSRVGQSLNTSDSPTFSSMTLKDLMSEII